MTKKYIGFKMVTAWEQTKDEKEGYAVKYSDGYISWSPKDVFEKAYMQVGDNNTILSKNVDEFVKDYEISTIGEKTTIVKANLVNGFTIVESSSCVDVSNYNEEIGANICKDRIRNKIWELLGFLLQTAKEGIN